jgi:uncharacterized repeat protein (TIGR03803 family)
MLALGAAATSGLPAQTVTALFSFNREDGQWASNQMIQATDGDLYGTTQEGGASGKGTIFRITPGGAFSELYDFCSQPNCSDGASPMAGLVQATNGFLYGTAFEGGFTPSECLSGCGTVFKISLSGEFTTVYEFCKTGTCTDGARPAGGLIQAINGDLYGTTEYGGSQCESCGTVFRMTPGGTLTTLFNFTAGAGGERPIASLVQAANGNLYGTTALGGESNTGTIFKITPTGTWTGLASFCTEGANRCSNGEAPYGAMVQGPDGNLYGTTMSGGAYGFGEVYQVTPEGALSVVYSFCAEVNCTDGELPLAGLVLATDGNLYGTTEYGGVYGFGTLFRVSPGGAFMSLYSFCPEAGCEQGSNPVAALVQGTNGDLYGTTLEYGGYGQRTIFSLSAGLGPFVKAQPPAGKVGAAVIILGSDLSGATSVTFNGTTASFTVATATEITTAVPAGAHSGAIQVMTPGGALASNVPFFAVP